MFVCPPGQPPKQTNCHSLVSYSCPSDYVCALLVLLHHGEVSCFSSSHSARPYLLTLPYCTQGCCVCSSLRCIGQCLCARLGNHQPLCTASLGAAHCCAATRSGSQLSFHPTCAGHWTEPLLARCADHPFSVFNAAAPGRSASQWLVPQRSQLTRRLLSGVPIPFTCACCVSLRTICKNNKVHQQPCKPTQNLQ